MVAPVLRRRPNTTPYFPVVNVLFSRAEFPQETIMDKSNTKKFPVGFVVFWAVIRAMKVPTVREFVGATAGSVQETVTEVRKFVGQVAGSLQEAVTPAPSPRNDASPQAVMFGAPTDGERIFREGLRSSRPFQTGPSVELPGESRRIRRPLTPPCGEIDGPASAATWRPRGLTDPRSAVDARPAVILGRPHVAPLKRDQVFLEGAGMAGSKFETCRNFAPLPYPFEWRCATSRAITRRIDDE